MPVKLLGETFGNKNPLSSSKTGRFGSCRTYQTHINTDKCGSRLLLPPCRPPQFWKASAQRIRAWCDSYIHLCLSYWNEWVQNGTLVLSDLCSHLLSICTEWKCFCKDSISGCTDSYKTAEADIKRMLGEMKKPLTKYFQAASQGANGAEVLFSVVRVVELLCVQFGKLIFFQRRNWRTSSTKLDDKE